jgi:hypothetical protein
VAWVRLSDDYYDNPKFARVPALGELLYLRCLAWSNRNLSDGFLPVEAIRRLAPSPWRRLASSLERADLWEPEDGGYRIHDYLVFNKSREEIETKRAQDSARKARGT